METRERRSPYVGRSLCLNRTMQYGNAVRILSKVEYHLSLNRTMQYGNCMTYMTQAIYITRLNRTMQYGNCIYTLAQSACQKFKSYYVVWKPEPDGSAKSCVGGLNRTMQYGNSVRSSKSPSKFPGLNRTMQYGNPKGIYYKI